MLLFVLTKVTLFSQESRDPFLSGIIQLDKGNYSEAIVHFENAAKNNLSKERLYLKTGEAYYLTGDYETCILYFEKANAIEEHCADLWLAKTYAQRKDYDQAVSSLTEHLKSSYRTSETMIKKDPAFDALQYQTSWYNLWQNDWYSPEEKLHEEVKYFIRKNELIDALTFLDKKIKESKSPELLHIYRAEINVEMGNYKAAAMDYTDGLNAKLISQKYQNLIARGKCYLKSEQYEKAIGDFNKAHRFLTENFDLYLIKAETYEKLEDFEKAVNNIETYLSYFPEDKENIQYCGELHLKNNNSIKALRYFNRNLAVDQSNPEYFKSRGKVYLKTRTYKYALEDFSMALDLNPRDGECYSMKGLVRYHLNDLSGACEDWNMAVKLGHASSITYLIDYCKQ